MAAGAEAGKPRVREVVEAGETGADTCLEDALLPVSDAASQPAPKPVVMAAWLPLDMRLALL